MHALSSLHEILTSLQGCQLIAICDLRSRVVVLTVPETYDDTLQRSLQATLDRIHHLTDRDPEERLKSVIGRVNDLTYGAIIDHEREHVYLCLFSDVSDASQIYADAIKDRFSCLLS
jgi:hypothetical protein